VRILDEIWNGDFAEGWRQDILGAIGKARKHEIEQAGVRIREMLRRSEG